MSALPRTLRMLFLGDQFHMLFAQNDVGPEVKVIATGDERADYTYNGRYYLSPYSVFLAEQAEPSKYDAVVVGNNEGNGLLVASHLPQSVRSRTMILWNDYEESKSAPYRKLGIGYFGQRSPSAGIFSLQDFCGLLALGKVS